MTLEQHIEEIRQAMQAGVFVNEASISQGVVLRLLQALGWAIFDSKRVAPEYGVEGRRVDFALCHPPAKPVVFLEVKQSGKSEGADRQLFEYAFVLGVPMAVLTDGQEWHFYLPAEQGSYYERRVYKLDLLARSVDECAARLRRYLDFEAVCSGRALDAARLDYKDVSRDRQVKRTLPRAWAELVEERDELLVDLVAEKVESLCGFKPDPDTVVSYLASITASTPAGPTAEQRSPQPRDVTVRPARARSSHLGMPATGFALKGERYQCGTARDVLKTLLEELCSRDPTFAERFASRPKHGRKRRYLARDKYKLIPGRRDLCEDHSHQLSNGWWIGVNYSRRGIETILRMACEVAGLEYGVDLQVNLG